MSNQLLDEEYVLSNSEDEDGNQKIKTKRTRHKSMSPTKKSNSDGVSEVQMATPVIN